MRAHARPLRYPALDGLRTIAFLLVFGIHYLAFPWGFSGVDAFFVLSGFLITGILYDSRDAPNRAYNFYIRRTLRIFPLYYLVCLLLVAAYPFYRWEWNWHWLIWPAYLGNFVRFIHPAAQGSSFQMMADAQPLSRTHPEIQLYFGHFWSLCVEEQFYLVWPWVVFWVKDRRRLIYICLAAVVLCPLLRVWANTTLPPYMLEQQVLYRATPFRLDALLIGGLIALVQRGRYSRSMLVFARITFAMLVIVIVVWHALHHSEWHSFKAYVHPPWVFTWGLFIVDVFFACVVIMALEPRSITYRLFNLGPLRWFGRLTYGAYVFHDIFHVAFVRFSMRHFSTWKLPTAAIALVTTIVISWISYHVFEEPFIDLKSRMTR